MSITLHCQYCNKKIEAADSAAGKWGKCPYCHNKLYVPDIKADDDLKLAPIDEDEEKRKQQLMAETYRLEQEILLEREEGKSPSGKSVIELSDKELTANIILYLCRMANAELDEAEQILGLITPYGARAQKIVEGIALSEIPESELEEIPQQVLSGLIRALRNKLT